MIAKMILINSIKLVINHLYFLNIKLTGKVAEKVSENLGDGYKAVY